MVLGLIGSMPLLSSQVVFMPFQKLKLCLCHSQFSIPPSMPFSTIQHENGSINSRISVYTFVLTKIILCSDLERLLGVSGTQEIQNFQILAKIRTSQENLFFYRKSKTLKRVYCFNLSHLCADLHKKTDIFCSV